jgi:hypothetical protein
VLAVLVLWIEAWWLAAITVGFRLRAGAAVWISLTVVSALAALIGWFAVAGPTAAGWLV